MITVKLSLIVISIGIVTFLHVRKLTKKGLRKEALVYTGMMGLVMIIGSLVTIEQVKMPSPTLPFDMLYQSIGKAILHQ